MGIDTSTALPSRSTFQPSFAFSHAETPGASITPVRTIPTRAMWLAMLTRCLEFARLDPSGEIFNLLEESHHPILSVYARVERMVRTRAREPENGRNP